MTDGREQDEAGAEADVEVDCVVVGAGPAGEVAAGRLADHGMETAVVEVERVGGDCSFWACIPSKALLRPGHARHAALRVPGAAQAVTGPLDADAVLAFRDEAVSGYDDSGQVPWLDGKGVRLVRGEGRLVGERVVEVRGSDGGTTRLTARHAVVLATGSAAAVPDVPGLRDAAPWTSRDVTSARRVPERLVVIGAGVVGLEMTQAFTRLGSSVTLLERGDALLPRLEPVAGRLLTEALTEDGVDVRFGADVRRVARDADGTVTVTLADGEVVADEVLVAAGRRPRTDALGLEVVGLEPGLAVPVDDTLRSERAPWLYAIGDVNGRVLLTHQGKYQGGVAADAIVARARGGEPPTTAWADHAAVPQVVVTDPEVAAVGLTAAQARDAGHEVRVLEHDMSTAGSYLHSPAGYRGGAVLVVDAARDVVLGATFVGQDVADLLHSATVAVVGEVPLSRLRHAVPSFPTMSEVWLRLLEEAGV
ncbi:dihydrolipoyl dehydrogenase family protein [Aquipuribacter nitratireducens]|uniref:Dihydrolipoyl dehydrogenase family protein n=1 Tax=Aquipuribacter nitratireducens TaxID=650104 RepID=A0ABW0GLF4_9MICO